MKFSANSIIVECIRLLQTLGPEKDAVKTLRMAVGDAWPHVEDTRYTICELLQLWNDDFERDVERMLMDRVKPRLTDRFKLMLRLRLENAVHALGSLQGAADALRPPSISVASCSMEEVLLWAVENLWELSGEAYTNLVCISYCTGQSSPIHEIYREYLA